MTPPPRRLGPGNTMLDRLVSVLVRSTKRQYVLIVVGYVTGVLGLATVFAHELWLSVPEDPAVTASILLMGVSFLSLFLAILSGPIGGQ